MSKSQSIKLKIIHVVCFCITSSNSPQLCLSVYEVATTRGKLNLMLAIAAVSATMKTIYNEVCGLSRVTVTLLLQTDVTLLNFVNVILQCCEHHKQKSSTVL